MIEKKLYSPKVIKEIIHKHGFRFSKSLGQNFLIDGNIIDNICDGSDINSQDEILEIGPGIGTLTQGLCKRAKKVLAVELDKRLIPILEDTLSIYKNLEIINGDILKIDLEKLLKEKFENEKIKVVANLPYYITTPIIMKLLEERLNIEKIVVMVQKEVAERMKAKPGSKDYGALSIATQYYSKPQIIVNVPKNVFMPRPNVDSSVILFDVYDKPPIEVLDEKLMFMVVKAAFGKRRKTLSNSLSSGNLGISKKQVVEVLNMVNINPKLRGEVLDIKDFAKISDCITSIKN